MRDALPSRLSSLSGWHLLAVGVVVLYLSTVLVSAATAPPLTKTASGVPTATPADGTAANGTAPPGEPKTLLETDATLVGAQGSFVKQAGEIAVVRPNGAIAWDSPDTPWAFFDVDPLPRNRVLASFVVKDASNCGEYEPPCSRTGFRVYNVTTGEIEREWTYPVRRHLNRESHDADMLSNGNVVVVGMDEERIFVVNDAGEVVWEWRASNFYQAPDDPTMRDWLHMNDVDVIPCGGIEGTTGDGRCFLVSVRNANQLLVVQRGTGVVEVVNADADDGNDANCRQDDQLKNVGDSSVRCGDPEVFNHQHNPQWLSPTKVLVADSDNDRVVMVEKVDGSWEVTYSLKSAGGKAFHWPRDVDLLRNGNLLVTDSLNGRVVEVNLNGTVVWSVTPAEIPYEADRLPGGEYPGPATDGSDNRTFANSTIPTVTGTYGEGAARMEIPVITTLYGAASGALTLPYWYTQWHFLGLLVTVLTAVVSLIAGYRGE